MNPLESIYELIQLGYELERSGDIGAAIHNARQALGQADELGCAKEKAAARVCLSYLFNHMGRFDEALKLADEAVDIASNEPVVQVDALITQGICLTDLGQLDQTEQSLISAMDLAREHGNRKALQKCLHILAAGVFIPRGQFDLAVTADEESLRMAEDLALNDLRWLPLLTLGWVNWATGKRIKALEILDRLRDAVLPYSLGEGYYYCLAADLTQDGDHPDDAADLYNKARFIADIIGDPGLGAELRTGLSRYHRRHKNTSTAYNWACDAVAIAIRSKSSPALGPALIEKALCQWALGDFKSADQTFHRARDHAHSIGARFDLARSQLFLAAMLVQQQSKNAAEVLNDAMNTIRSGGFWFLLERERTLVFPLIATLSNNGGNGVSRSASEMLQQLEQLSPPPLHIISLGSFELRQGRRLIPAKNIEKRRAGDLIRLLLTSQDYSIESDRAMEAIWPGKNTSTATANLHQATSTLRRALEPDLPDKFPSRYLKVHHGRISLKLPDESRIDFEEFEELFKKQQYAQALKLFSGDLFPGSLAETGAIIFREHLRQRAIQAALNVATQELEAENYEASLEACLKALRLEPWQEKGVLIGMQALIALDNRAGAIRLYQRLAASLQDELGVEPQKELQQYFQSILG